MAHLSLFDTVTLTDPTAGGRGISAIELLQLATSGKIANWYEIPESLTVCCALLPGLEQGPWRDDAHRTAVLVPYLRRLVSCTRDQSADIRRAFRLADYSCRDLLPNLLDGIQNGRAAIQLRTLPPIVDVPTARGASTTLDTLAPTIYLDFSRAVKRGTRAILDHAIGMSKRNASAAASHAVAGAEAKARLAADADGSQPLGPMSWLRAEEAVTKEPQNAAGGAGATALWIARAICYAHAPPPPFWYSIGHAAFAALDSKSGREAGGAAIEEFTSALLDIVLGTH
jgi:hypothetical protein